MKFFAWLRHWIRTAVAASSRPDFYRRLEDRKPGEAAAHLALLSLFLWTLPFLIIFFVEVPRALRYATENVLARVPAGTVFEMKDGRLSSNLEQPLKFSDDGSFVVIDTATATAALPPYEAGSINTIVIGYDGIMQRTSDHEARFSSFKKIPNFSVSREKALGEFARWTPLALFLGALFMTLMVFGATWVGFLLSVALHGLLLWFALKLVKRAWPWKRAFIASAYAATAPIVLNAILSAAGFNLGTVPNVLYWLILLWIVYDAHVRGNNVPGKGGSDGKKEEIAVDRPGEDGRQAS
ncbi:MAG: DUF1189 family protein [Patescibacteria group bacterium]|nr:MAG: DUF1189 family protein [Patescibacteria group bacterium]